jgi:hypothetical protein
MLPAPSSKLVRVVTPKAAVVLMVEVHLALPVSAALLQ